MSLFDSASLVVTPNGYKEDKLYSIKPTDGSGDLVVTRATTATRVNSAGLIEQVPYNLLTYSEQFDNASWTKFAINVSANAGISPNGSTTADKIIPTASLANHLIHNTPQYSSSGDYTMSVYVKADGYSKVAIRESWSVGFFASYDLTLGTVIDSSTSQTNTITPVGNGWFRLTTSRTFVGEIVLGIIPLPDSYTGGNPLFAFTGNGTSGILTWGAQLVTGTSTKEYFPTTDRLNVPRLDYTNSSCPSILVEPQRTNLVTYSEQFDNGAWVKDNVSISANSVTSPSGIQNADSILETATTTTHTTYNRASMTSGQAYTQSCYFKANGRNRVIMQIFDNATQYANAIFDLSSGVVVASFGTATIQNMTNGWYRCTITGTSPATGLGYCVIGLCENTYSTPSVFPTYLGDITKGVYAWGFQVEAGSYATSYIPTVASSVTRNADVISKTGISSLIGQTEGTLYAEYRADNINISARIISVSNGTFANRIVLLNDGGSIRVFVANASVGQVDISFGTWIGSHKIAVAYANNDLVVFLDGVLVATDTSISVPTCSDAQLGTFEDNSNGNPLGGSIKAAALWKTRLSNTELATLTTI